MYHRRLLLLAALVGLGMLVLAGQLARLTLADPEGMRERAESVLQDRRFIPTTRGRVLDRQGRVLAVDRPSYQLAVEYQAISGRWSYERARAEARAVSGERWRELSWWQRERRIHQLVPAWEARLEALWDELARLGGIERERLDERRRAIRRQVQRVATDVWRRRQVRRSESLGEPVDLADVAIPIREQREAHPLVFGVEREALLTARTRVAAAGEPEASHAERTWETVSIMAWRHRDYPMDRRRVSVDRRSLPEPLRHPTPREVVVEGVAIHQVGWMRDLWREDLERRPFMAAGTDGGREIDLEGYRPGDRVGASGAEARFEDRLRGARGQEVRRLDTGVRSRQAPASGEDVILTLDAELQARLRAVLDPAIGLSVVQPWHRAEPLEGPHVPEVGDQLNSAVVVLDVDSGHVLASVSEPGFSRHRMENDPAFWDDRLNRPWVDRVRARAYQPGSTVKPLVLASAMTRGLVGRGETITCRGHLDADRPNHYRCWIYRNYNATHGPLGGVEALARSCNIYFYTLGRRFGPGPLAEAYAAWGLGRPVSGGLGGAVAGDLPVRRENLSTADGIFMAIGQGPVRWTPLQAAAAYATLARGGRYRAPALVAAPAPAREPESLGLDGGAVRDALEGMHQVVHAPYGTGRHLALLDREPIFNVPGVRIRGKSGTAQAVPLRLDADGDGRVTRRAPVARRGNHAWFIALARPEEVSRPEYVISVVVEYGGSGGTVAGPIVNQVIHALRDEGYL